MTADKNSERKKHWLLIVDDEDEIRSLITEKLKTLSDAHDEFRIMEAKDGLEATQKLRNQKFDCIITDLNMPKRTGQEVIQAVKRGDLNAKTPIIVVTAYPDASLPDMYLYLTMIEKPFKVNDLLKVVREQIKLGPIDQRVPVHIFNVFLTATENYFNEMFKLEMVRQNPLAKKSGDDFHDRSVVAVRMSMGALKTWMAFGTDNDLLNYFTRALKKDKDQVLEYLTSGIMSKMTGLMPKATLEIHESLLITPENIQNYSLSGLQGITVPFKSIYGMVYCEAMVGNFALNKKA